MFSRENINFHSGMRVVRPVFFFTLSHNEGEGKEREERDSLEGSITVTSSDLIRRNINNGNDNASNTW